MKSPSIGVVRTIVALGVILRIVAVLTFPVYPLVDNTADTAIYDAGAHALAVGEGYQWHGAPTAFFPVGWPLLLAGAYRALGDAPRSGQWLNLLLSLVVLAGGWWMTRRLFGEAAGRWSAIILALAPHQVIYPALLMSDVAFAAFFTTSLALLAAWVMRRSGVAILIVAGVVMGCATLIRGPALVFPLAVLFAARTARAESWGRSCGAALIFGAALLVPLAPWAARNHAVFGRTVLVANDGGMNFLMGNHHGATGARHEPADGLPDTGDEVRDDREGYRRGLAFIRQRPLEFASLLPRKLVRLVVPAPLLTYRAELRAKWPEALALALLAADQLLHLLLWGALIAGVMAARRTRRDPGLRFLLIALALWLGVHLAYLGGARYFFPAMPIVTALAASRFRGAGERVSGEGA